MIYRQVTRSLRSIFLAIAVILAGLNVANASSYVPSAENLKARENFSDARFGIFIHWGIYSMLGQGEWVLHSKNIDSKEYSRLAAGFDPSKFNAREWVKAIKKSGAKYITITSRHHDGFSMYGSKASPYNIVDATPFGRDVLKELAEACEEEGIALHFYYSHLDWGREDFYPLGRTGHGTGRACPADTVGSWKHYLDFMNAQLTELLTGYGKVGAIWFDGVWDMDERPREDQPGIWNLDNQYALIHRLQPACLVGNNHHLLPFEGEDIQIFERDIPGMNEYGLSGQEISRLPLETCQTMNHSWGYKITDKDYKTPEFLVKYLVRTAGKGANLLLNIGPRPDGTLPDEAIERLNYMGEWLGKYGESIYGTEGGEISEQPWGVVTRKGNTMYVHVLAKDSTRNDSKVEVPLPAHNVLSAKSFDGDKTIAFTHTPKGVLLDLPELPEDLVDYIVKLELAPITKEEEKCLAFLYKSMPLPDLNGYPFSYWLENVQSALEARKNAGWEIPEREFMHFVLPVRVNNEALDDFRTLYGAELRERTKGMSAEQAALEVNHWCHEMATYRPSDGRTLPPTGTIKAGLGRCGEESVLAVAALRAAGVPARQVYTPRWAHTDDNHAWVEVFVDGNWHFMGACEPEPVLDLAWFNAPVSRAMLLHTKAYGDYNGPEDVISKTNAFTEINVIKSYIPTRRTKVKVVDVDGKPVEGADVEFKIYNYAEFYSVAKAKTDSAGMAALDTGLGDVTVWASKGDKFGIALAKGEESEVVLDHKTGDKFSMDLVVVPPVENPIPSKATEEQTKENALRFVKEDSIRNARPKGNDDVLNSFRKAHKGKNGEALLASLSKKDLGDVTSEVLEDAAAHWGKTFKPYRDCPRVSIEPLLPYFKEIGSGLEAGSPEEILEWTATNIKLDDAHNPQRLPIPPLTVWRSKVSDSNSRNIFFVAACRSKGLEARIDEVTGKTQYKKGKDWVDVSWGEKTGETLGKGGLRASYEPVSWLKNPLYYRHFTLSKMDGGKAKLLSFDEEKEEGWQELLADRCELDEGWYCLTSGVRMADGSVAAHLEFFNVEPGKLASVPLVLKAPENDWPVIGNIDAEKEFKPENSDEMKTILAETGRGYFAIAVVKDFTEPSIHALRQLGASAEELNSWGRPLVVLAKDENSLGRIKEYLSGLKNVSYGTDPDGKVLEMIYEGCKPDQKSAPVVMVGDSFGRVIYYSQGYNTSLGEQLKSCINSPALKGK